MCGEQCRVGFPPTWKTWKSQGNNLWSGNVREQSGTFVVIIAHYWDFVCGIHQFEWLCTYDLPRNRFCIVLKCFILSIKNNADIWHINWVMSDFHSDLCNMSGNFFESWGTFFKFLVGTLQWSTGSPSRSLGIMKKISWSQHVLHKKLGYTS